MEELQLQAEAIDTNPNPIPLTTSPNPDPDPSPSQAEAIDTAALDAQQLAEEELAAKARCRGDVGEI